MRAESGEQMKNYYNKMLKVHFILSAIFLIAGLLCLAISIYHNGLHLLMLAGLISIGISYGIAMIHLHKSVRRANEHVAEVDKQYKYIHELQKEVKLKEKSKAVIQEDAVLENKRCRMVFNNVDDVIISYDYDFNILMSNNKFTELLKYNDLPYESNQLTEVIQLDSEIEMLKTLTEQARRSREAVRDEICIYFKKQGELFLDIIVTPVIDDHNQIESFIIIARDVSDYKKHEAHVHKLIYYDYLTELPNRDLLLEDLATCIEESSFTKKRSAIICIGLDEFKKLNDTFGHTRGDLILKAVSNRLVNLVAHQHQLYRIGGDEFAILVKNSAKGNEMMRLLSQINVIFNQAIVVEGNSLYVSASTGIAIRGLHGDDAHTLVTNADTAMNSVKRTGSEKHAYFNKSMKVDIIKNVQIENAIRDSIRRDELYLDYQPQISQIDGSIRGYEALLRWETPQLGFVPPSDFIPILESTHQIIPIGRWVLEQAIRFQKKVKEETGQDIIICVNISGVQLMQNDFVEVVTQLIRQLDMNPRFLELEVTESHVMNALAIINAKLKTLQEIGIKIALDDFGTGYSSLNYLRKLNCDILKIDKSFIDDLIDEKKDVEVILGSIISLAKQLGFEIIAEGVELGKQIVFLSKHGCDYFQGYYFSRPVDGETAVELLRESTFKQLLAQVSS